MRITKAEFVRSIFMPEQYKPCGLPEIALAGRSNAGKSSLVNALCGRKLANVSQEPGKTRSINSYRINDSFLLMDLPGYGYARRSGEEREQWRMLIDGYFDRTKTLSGFLLLCDIRHEPSDQDMQMMQWISFSQLPCTIVATKADKIARRLRNERAKAISGKLGNDRILCFSDTDVNDRDALIFHLFDLLPTEIKRD